MKIRWHGMLGTQHSWAFTQQYLIRAMEKIGGHDIFLRSTNGLEHFPDDLRHLLVPGYHGSLSQGPTDYIDEQANQITIDPKSPLPEMQDKNVPYDLELAYTIFFQAPRRFFPYTKARALIWNFESSVLPPGWQEYHRALDYILPSSQYSYDIFAANGIPKDKMLVVPHGVDTKMFNADIPPYKLQTEKRVKFLHNAIPHHRKLHDRVLEGYLDAFTGDDDVCLVMKTKFLTPAKDKPFEVDIRTVLEAAFKGRKNPPEVEIINEYIPDIGSLYTACDAVISMSSCEGFCLLPGTPIDTVHGTVAIENISGQDFVYTHLGNKKRVVHTTNRTIKENIIGIRRHGCDTYFSGTKTHPHLAVKRHGRKFSALRRLVDKGELEAEWIGLGDLEKGDLVVIPKPKFDYIENNIIDIKKNIDFNVQEENGQVWLTNSFNKKTGSSSLSEIADKVGCSFQHVSRTLNSGCGLTALNKKIARVADELAYKKPEPLKFERFVEIDDHLARFFGMYIAEGSISSAGNSFNINLHSDENYGQDLARTICKRFDIPFCETRRGNLYQLSGSSKIFSSILSNMFGSGALNKHIPFDLYKSPFIGDILHGIFYGDGSATKNRYSFSTSSITLMQNIFQLLLHNNIFANIKTDGRRKNNNYIISVSSFYNEKFDAFVKPYKYNKRVSLLSSNKNNAIIEGMGCFLVPINNVTETYYEGDVYNLEIEEDSSFNSLGMTTHNCLPLLEALACDKLIIAPRHGGQLDFLNDDNSLLVDTGEMSAPISMQYWTHSPDAVVGDPNVKHFSELLRKVYENLNEEKARVKEAAATTVEKFTWEAAAQMILDLPIPEVSRKLTKTRKVLYIVPYTMAGGGEVWVREAIRKLDRNLYEPHIAFVNGVTPELSELFQNEDVVIEDLSNRGRQFALKCLIESENYAIVHFYNSFGVYNILRNAWRQGYRNRIVETVHSELNWNDSMVKVAARDKMVSIIVSVSNTLAQKMVKLGNKNVALVQQQVNWDKFKIERHKGILDELGIPKNFVVGFVGRLSPEKNVPIILRCARGMPDVSFVIVGDGPQSVPLKQMAASLKNVFFVGRRTDVEKFYAAFDVLMLPSKMEGMPLVILEAMTAGTPIVASDVGAVTEVVKDGVSGFTSKDPNDYLLFVTCLAKLRDEKVWQECSSNSKAITSALEAQGDSFNINNVYNMLFKEV